jgi:hypothetical protein
MVLDITRKLYFGGGLCFVCNVMKNVPITDSPLLVPAPPLETICQGQRPVLQVIHSQKEG